MDSLRIVLLILGVAVIAGIYFWETRTSRRRRTDVEDDLDTTYLDELGEARGRKDFGYTRSGDMPALGDASQMIVDAEKSAQDLPRMGGEFEDDTSEPAAVLEKVEVTQENAVSPEEFAAAAELAVPGQLVMDLQTTDELIIESINSITPTARRANDAEINPEHEMVIAVTLMCKDREPLSGQEISTELQRLGFEHGFMDLFHHYAMGNPESHEPLFSVASVVNPGSFDTAALDTFSTPGLALFSRITSQDAGIQIFETLLEVGDALAVQLNVNLCDQNRNPLSKQLINHMREEIVEFTRRTRIKF